MSDLEKTRADLSEAFRPVFDEQRAVWEREGPKAMEAFTATGAALSQIGGNCPVQAEGAVDGQAFYFRARGDGWQFHVAPTKELIFGADTFYIERDYGEFPDAGWMPNHEALAFIVQAISEFRSLAPLASQSQRDDAAQAVVADPGTTTNSNPKAPQ